jgi:hypothetical protein
MLVSVHRLRGEHTYPVPSCDITASCHVAYPYSDYVDLLCAVIYADRHARMWAIAYSCSNSMRHFQHLPSLEWHGD